MTVSDRGGKGRVWLALVTGMEGIIGCGVWGVGTGFENGGMTRTGEGDPEKCLFSRFGAFWLADDVGGCHGGARGRRRGVWRDLRQRFIGVFWGDCRRGEWP